MTLETYLARPDRTDGSVNRGVAFFLAPLQCTSACAAGLGVVLALLLVGCGESRVCENRIVPGGASPPQVWRSPVRLELQGDGTALVNSSEQTDLLASSGRIEELLGEEFGRPERIGISVDVEAGISFSAFVSALWVQLQHDSYALACAWQTQSGDERVQFELYPCDVYGCRDLAAPMGNGSSLVLRAVSTVLTIVRSNEVRTPPDSVGAHVLKRCGAACDVGDVLLEVPESVPASYVLSVVRSCALAGVPRVSIAPIRSKGKGGRFLSVRETLRSVTILGEGLAPPPAENVVGVHVTVFVTLFKPVFR